MTTEEVRGRIQDAPLRLLASRIRSARRDRGLSLDHVAGEAGTSRQHLINLEKGKHRPRPEMLERIANALDRPLDYFLAPEEREPESFPDRAVV